MNELCAFIIVFTADPAKSGTFELSSLLYEYMQSRDSNIRRRREKKTLYFPHIIKILSTNTNNIVVLG